MQVLKLNPETSFQLVDAAEASVLAWEIAGSPTENSTSKKPSSF